MSNASPWKAALLGVGAYMLITLGVSAFPSGLAAASSLSVAVLGFTLAAVGAPRPQTSFARPPTWDLPVRMMIATAMVIGITGTAAVLGPRWSGLLSPFPVFACVMAVFAHHSAGPSSAHRVLRGILIGSFAFMSFFVVLALALERTAIVLAYGLAVLVALSVNGASLFVLLRERRTG
jgi:hypothetical protein